MTLRGTRHWLLAYDIREPKRLRRIHAYLCRHGVPLQYSVFGLELDEPGLRRILDDLASLMDTSVDDIRAYHIPERSRVWTIGQQALPEGVELHATAVMRLLKRQPTPSASPHQEDLPGIPASPWGKRKNHALRSGTAPRY